MYVMDRYLIVEVRDQPLVTLTLEETHFSHVALTVVFKLCLASRFSKKKNKNYEVNI